MKKAILVVSFGTTHLDTLEKTIVKVENKIRSKFKDYEVFRAFTSHIIIKRLMKNNGIKVETPEEMLEKLYEKGYEEVILEPLHVIGGEEFDYIKNVYNLYKDKFKVIKLARPLLYFEGEEERVKDYTNFVKVLKNILPECESYVLVGHGTMHPQGTAYWALQSMLIDNDMENILIGTVEGYPGPEQVLKRLKKLGAKKVLIAPMMLVAGDHAKNDIAGDDEDSWKNMLEAEGFKVEVFLRGLGEFDEIENLYINHLEDAILGNFESLGKTKKGVKK